jgi:hypothetical protein
MQNGSMYVQVHVWMCICCVAYEEWTGKMKMREVQLGILLRCTMGVMTMVAQLQTEEEDDGSDLSS